MNVPISVRVKIISDLRLSPERKMAEKKMEVSSDPYDNATEKINHRENKTFTDL